MLETIEQNEFLLQFLALEGRINVTFWAFLAHLVNQIGRYV